MGHGVADDELAGELSMRGISELGAPVFNRLWEAPPHGMHRVSSALHSTKMLKGRSPRADETSALPAQSCGHLQNPLAEQPPVGILDTMELDELTAEAAKLSEDDRASLAARLLHGLEKPHHGVSDEEVMSRVREGDADDKVMLTFDQLVSGLRFRAR